MFVLETIVSSKGSQISHNEIPHKISLEDEEKPRFQSGGLRS